MNMKLDFVKDKNRLWIEVGKEQIGLLTIDENRNPLVVAIKLEGKDLLKLYKQLEKVGFPL